MCVVVGTTFVPLNACDIINIDNHSWIFVHVYVVQTWKRILILFTLQHVVGD
jgi:hypothetical protein